ncbi:hypothetical protein C8R45DRAFT_350282 [Mycena sanguinolenta]|nr:hypothetical protein C8R45DRAFT_350282 [Mycena sanguinolenta]
MYTPTFLPSTIVLRSPISTQSALSSLGKRLVTLTVDISKSLRNEIQRKWNQIADEAGAAGIEFVNEIDDQEVPDKIAAFQYLEGEYQFKIGIDPEHLPLVECPCLDGDCATRQCHGQSCDYDSQGRIKNISEVDQIVQCNERCLCPDDCPNRDVSLRPRQFGIQIFKTEKAGWGVRSTADIAKGSIVGFYTGYLSFFVRTMANVLACCASGL